jgi:acetoin utilization protein AcuB
MLVIDLMTKNVVTVHDKTLAVEALKIMRETGFRRLPVLDEDDHPVGVVTQRRINELKSRGGMPLLRHSDKLSKYTVFSVMNKRLVTVKPSDTVEHATHKAQSNKVGSLLVIEDSKLVGIVTTNDIFYGVVNPTLGIGDSGSRVVIVGGGTGPNAEKILSVINKMGIEVKIIWSIYSQTNKKSNLVVHIEQEDPRSVVVELARSGFDVKTVNR